MTLTGQQAGFEELPGRSLLPLLRNPTEQWSDRSVISDYACDGTRVPMRMVRHGRWKATFALGLPPLLFDLEQDPYEWSDLSGENSAQGILKELHTTRLFEWMECGISD